MNKFQEMCIGRCVELLKTKIDLSPFGFEEVVQGTEHYYLAKIKFGGRGVDIYVYNDEAGYMVDGKEWTICEKPDYETEKQLVDSFCLRLAEELRR